MGKFWYDGGGVLVGSEQINVDVAAISRLLLVEKLLIIIYARIN